MIFLLSVRNIVSLASNIKHLCQTMLVDVIDAFAIRKCELNPKTLLLIHLDAIGDYVLFRNFISEVRNSGMYHDYSITLCGNEQYRDLAEWLDSGYINDFIWIDRRKFRFNLLYRFALVRMISERGFAITVNAASSRIYYWGDAVVKASGSFERIGSAGNTINCKPWQKDKSDKFYTRLIPVTNNYLFEFLRNKVFFTEILDEPIKLVGPYFEPEKIPSSLVTDRPYAVLFPGAGDTFRQWNCNNFADVAIYLGKKYGYVVVIAGSVGDNLLANHISSLIYGVQVIDLTGRSTLPELIGIIANAEILISNETSAVHFAVASGARVICISNGNQLGRFSPYPPEMYSEVSYLFPREVVERYDNFFELCETLASRSHLNINEISVRSVCEQIDTMLTNVKLKVC